MLNSDEYYTCRLNILKSKIKRYKRYAQKLNNKKKSLIRDQPYLQGREPLKLDTIIDL